MKETKQHLPLYMQISSKKGLTMIELVVAIAIASIVGIMTISIFLFPQRTFNKGNDLSEVQFKLRLASDVITREVRLGTGVEILPENATIPDPVDPEKTDVYLFIRSADNALVRKDKNGERVIVQGSGIELQFAPAIDNKTLAYTLNGTEDDESFSLSSQVLVMNMPDEDFIEDNSNLEEGRIIRIEHNFPEAQGGSLSFDLESPHIGEVNKYFYRSFTAYNYSGITTYTKIGGTLPPGVSLHSSGWLEGTPSAPGTFTFDIRLTDDEHYSNRSFSVIIDPEESEFELPVASNLQITGTLRSGYTLTGTYDYTDPLNQPEGESQVTWYSMDDIHGTGKTSIKSDTATSDDPSTLDLTYIHSGKFISFEVVPVAQAQMDPENEEVELVPERYGWPSTIEEPLQVAANSAPVALNVTITHSGELKPGTTLTGSYVYSDPDNDLEAGTTFQWYRGRNQNQMDPISGANELSYTTSNDDNNYYFFFSVTPRAQTGVHEGDTVISANVLVKK